MTGENRTADRAVPEMTGSIVDLAAVLDVLRRERTRTRPEVARQAHLGRNIVSDRLILASRLGLAEIVGTLQGPRGRAPERWRYRAEAGVVLGACLGVASIQVALTDAQGSILDATRFEWQVSRGPEETLHRVDAEFRALLGDRPAGDVWGIGVGLPSGGQGRSPVRQTRHHLTLRHPPGRMHHLATGAEVTRWHLAPFDAMRPCGPGPRWCPVLRSRLRDERVRRVAIAHRRQGNVWSHIRVQAWR